MSGLEWLFFGLSYFGCIFWVSRKYSCSKWPGGGIVTFLQRFPAFSIRFEVFLSLPFQSLYRTITIYIHNYYTQIVNVRFCLVHQTHIRGLLFLCRISFWCWAIGMLDIWGCCRNRELILYRIIRMWSLWYFYIFCYIWHKTYLAHISFYSHMPLIV